MVCHRQTGDLGKLGGRCNSVGVQRSGNQGSQWSNLSRSARGDEMRWLSSSSEAGKEGQIPPSSAFCSIQALNVLDDDHFEKGNLLY